MMCMRNPKFLFRFVMSLILGAGCVITWSSLTSYPSPRRAMQDDASRPSAAEAARFLQQSTWGPTPDLIAHVQDVGFAQFIEEQIAAPISGYPTLPLVPSMIPADCATDAICRRDNYSLYPVQTRFYTNALYGPDQLRQRVAFALHQILVVNGVDIGQGYPSHLTPYLQVLTNDAFENFDKLLYDITLNAAMGNYLDMANNNKADPNENYAREVLQLFTIGLNRLNPDGSPMHDSSGQNVPTYDQTIVTAFARVFTGWTFGLAQTPGIANYIDPMRVNAANHDTRAKTLLRGVTLPANQSTAKDLNDALENIFQDPNVGPFIGKQLIQHFVTSNPSSAYVERITNVFNNDRDNERGDIRAVVRAILLDPEARSAPTSQSGHLIHPVLLVTNLLRALNARSADGTSQSDGYLDPQSVSMGMDVFSPPSVFSYFSPFGGVPGSGLRGPEFGLLNTSTALRRANFVNTLVFSRINPNSNNSFNPSGTSLDFSALQPLAGDPAALVDSLNTLMMGGRMSQEMRAAVISGVQAVASSNTKKRAQTAVYLIATSSQYQVER